MRWALCFDPGQTTGWADVCSNGELNGYGELSTFEELDQVFHCTFDRAGCLKACNIVLIEQIPRGRHSFDPVGFEWAGAIKFLAHRHGVIHHSQPASVLSGPRNWPGVNLRTVKGRHARDAVAHGLAYFNITEFPPRKEAEA